MIAHLLADRAVRRPSWDRVATVLVSLAITFSWLPGYVSGLSSELVGLTRWVAVPLMLLSIIIEPDAYVRVIARPEVIVLVLATIMGIGGGVAAGNVAMGTLVSFMPNLLVVVFYARDRDPARWRGILLSLLIGSWVLCGIVVLAGFGLLPSGLAVVGPDLGGAVFERTWAGVSSSLLGPWVAMLLGSLGGFAFWPRASGKTVLVTLAIGLGAFVAMVTAQRAILLVAVLSLIIGGLGAITTAREQSASVHAPQHVKRNLVLILLSLILLLAVFWPVVREKSYALRYRISAMGSTSDSTGTMMRLNMWKYFLRDLVNRPRLIGQGDSEFIDTFGVLPHLLVGESYYEGGVLMLSAVVALMLTSAMAAVHAARYPVSVDTAMVARVLISVLIPVLTYLMLNPGLVTRFPYVLMGLALSLPTARASAWRGRISQVGTLGEQ